jgi:hypothetical protein
MIGRLQMSVTEAIECYGTIVEQVFSDVKPIARDGKFKASKLEKIFKEIVKERTGKEDMRMMDTGSDGQGPGCKTYVVDSRTFFS